jgi:hypothetical protein
MFQAHVTYGCNKIKKNMFTLLKCKEYCRGEF